MKRSHIRFKVGPILREDQVQLVKQICKKYPPSDYSRVADVAGGRGTFTRLLLKAGYRVTLIDPHGETVKGARFWKRKFWVRDHAHFDLIVGFRPCGASQKMVRAAKYKPVVLSLCGCHWIWPKAKSCKVKPSTKARDFIRAHGVRFQRHGRYDFFMHGRAA